VDSAKQTMGTVDKAAGDLRITMEEARKTMTTAKELMLKATQGNGLIPTLLNDGQLSANIKALISNLRQRGVLFYKDVTAEQEKQKTGKPATAR
jgi:phospholipid/cholesterol/gamma-HCH transport system substrate-binding protein